MFGSWRRPENLEGLIWFFDNVYDRIDKNINVFIIGGGLPNEQNKRIETNDNIHYLGFLEDPSQIISESILLIAPIFHGAGVKVKVVEALALGCAVLGTDIAFEGISIEDAEFVLTANSIDEFILKINTYNIDIQSKETFRRNFQKSYLNHAVSKYINSDYSSNG